MGVLWCLIGIQVCMLGCSVNHSVKHSSSQCAYPFLRYFMLTTVSFPKILRNCAHHHHHIKQDPSLQTIFFTNMRYQSLFFAKKNEPGQKSITSRDYQLSWSQSWLLNHFKRTKLKDERQSLSKAWAKPEKNKFLRQKKKSTRSKLDNIPRLRIVLITKMIAWSC